MTVITKPGVYADIPNEVYHADPVEGGSLSSSGARRLLPPSCPALFRWEQDNPPAPKRVWDYGTAAHAIVLGTGPEIVVVDANDWRTKAAREKAAAAREQGAVPLLTHEHDQVQAMAAALRAHPFASRLLRPDTGLPEMSMFWHDQRFDLWRRARLDWLSTLHTKDGRLIIPDYKTAHSAEPDAFAKAAVDHGYDQQADWYSDAAKAVLGEKAAFLFIVQEKTPPYLVTVIELDKVALERGRTLNAKAMDVYRECQAACYWPGYSDDVVLTPLPAWAERQFETALERGDYQLTQGRAT